ncbi:hypothetical protein [Bradyrhizobium sp. Leo121]|uniref:hypothetical protein n=1 Tax=Bradyrhizobium sp. Leo121 TaxID=1571195 RepID=UPI00102A33B9|nr:hypothetical protein [Bradyrhizobium sp. Leo121]RZN30487.1 hypothetical protein CWO90_20335 [Bradyrhizobium sp. Leo121]
MRLTCCVPYCKRTTDRPFDEWLCGKHWPLVDKKARRVYGRRARVWRRYHRHSDGEAACRLWRWIKRQAIERAAGIS